MENVYVKLYRGSIDFFEDEEMEVVESDVDFEEFCSNICYVNIDEVRGKCEVWVGDELYMEVYKRGVEKE